jgi:hypothetical protein
VIVPIFTNHYFQIRLSVNISSISSIREENCCVKGSISWHKPRGGSYATPLPRLFHRISSISLIGALRDEHKHKTHRSNLNWLYWMLHYLCTNHCIIPHHLMWACLSTSKSWVLNIQLIHRFKVILCTKLDSGLMAGLTLKQVYQKGQIRICHIVVTYQQSTNCVTILLIVTTPQHIIITFQKNIRLVREPVNEGQIVTSTSWNVTTI